MNIYVKYALITISLIISLAIVGQMDYNQDMVEIERYCLDVKEGVHSDYKNMINECEK